MPLEAPTMKVEVTAQWGPLQHQISSQPLSRRAATNRFRESTARDTMAEGSHPKQRTTSTRSGGARWAAGAAEFASRCLLPRAASLTDDAACDSLCFVRASREPDSLEAASITLFADLGKGWSGIWLMAALRLEGRAERGDSLGLSVAAGAALAASLGLTGADRADRRGLVGGTLLWRRGLAFGLEERVLGLADATDGF